jgi:hypothetical protein
LSRLTNTLRAVIEANEHPWRGDDCELSIGVRQGLEQVATHTQRHSDLAEQQARVYFFCGFNILFTLIVDTNFAQHHSRSYESKFPSCITSDYIQ